MSWEVVGLYYITSSEVFHEITVSSLSMGSWHMETLLRDSSFKSCMMIHLRHLLGHVHISRGTSLSHHISPWLTYILGISILSCMFLKNKHCVFLIELKFCTLSLVYLQ